MYIRGKYGFISDSAQPLHWSFFKSMDLNLVPMKEQMGMVYFKAYATVYDRLTTVIKYKYVSYLYLI